jgi:ribonuclease BN (tRNA processing enzyme)
MKLTVVGCSGSLPGADSAASCYLVEAEGFRVLLDLGNGALGTLQGLIDLDTIDAVLLSHMHPDHCVDLCGFYVYRRYHPSGERSPLPVYGPRGVAARMAKMYGREPDPGLRAAFDFTEWVSGTTSIGPFMVTAAQVSHSIEAYGMRIEHDGDALTYTGDTGPCDPLPRLAAGVDLLLSEATFHEGTPHPPGIHLTGREAGEYAQKGGAGRLVLTHVPPWNDPRRTLAEAVSAYSGQIDLARTGLTVDLSTSDPAA